MCCNVMREQPLGSGIPFPQEVCMKTWRAMEDAHCNRCKHFLFDGCMRKLPDSKTWFICIYVYSGYTYIAIHISMCS